MHKMKNTGTRPAGSRVSQDSELKTPTASSQYTYSSYTTYGTYTANGSSVSYSVNETATTNNTGTSSTSKARVRVARKKDANGNYLPHTHEHTTTTGEGKRRKHRVLKHSDGLVAQSIVYPSSEMSSTCEELKPLSTQDIQTTISTATNETTSSFTIQEKERHHHHHKGYDREHHKWCYKKRKEALEKSHPKPKYIPDDQTFTELGTDEPKGVPRFSQFAEPPDPTTTIDTATCVDTEIPETSNTATFASTDDSPIPRNVLFPPEVKTRGYASPKRMTNRGIQNQPEEEREWDPNEEKELRALVEKVRDHLYPRRRRPNTALTNRSVSAVDQQSAYGDQNRDPALNALMTATKTTTQTNDELFAAPQGPVHNLAEEQKEFNGMQRYLENQQVPQEAPALQPLPGSGSRRSTRSGTGTGEHSTASRSGTYSTGAYSSTNKYSTQKSGDYSYESVSADERKLDKAKKDNMTSVEMLVTANSKSGEFYEASEEHPNAVPFVEVTSETKESKSGTYSKSTYTKSYSSDEEEEEEEEEEEVEEEESTYEDEQ